MVSARQLLAVGLTHSAVHERMTSGRLHRVHRAVYAVGHRLLTPRGRWMAAVLAGGDGALLSHRAALALWDLRPAPSGSLDILVPGRGRRSRPGIRIHSSLHIHPDDRARVDGIPVTAVPRTLLDYADLARQQWLRVAVEAAIRRDLLDGRALDALLDRSAGRRGAAALRRAVDAVAGAPALTQSELENRFLALIRAAGLPEPQVNVMVDGYMVDCFWPEANLVVELDGWQFHRTRRQFVADRRKDAVHQLAGRRVLRFTDERIGQEPARVVAEVRAMAGSDLL